ncbi:MAG: dihydropteroate synthase [Candidatus Adiutrix intracellularis]|nr:dihydropteroate synthase [Candidatus Adiutrix intracellularis]
MTSFNINYPSPAAPVMESWPDFLSWRTKVGEWTLNFARPLIMSIINLTPDSFSDGGRFRRPEEAVEAALVEEAEGADLFDLGAESTRPGSKQVSEAEEWARLEPVLTVLAKKTRLPISVDTYKAVVAEKAIAAGAAIINDIYAGRKDPRILDVAAGQRVPIILMHMQGNPETMQIEPHYDDVVTEINNFLLERARAAEVAGVPRELIWLDPGVGFGKTVEHNLSIIRHFDRIIPRGYRRVMALSRKGFFGKVLGNLPLLKREVVTAAADAIAVLKGAEIIRVHRATPNREAVDLARAIFLAP